MQCSAKYANDPPRPRRRRLGLAARVDVGFGEMVQELAGAVGGIAIHAAPFGLVVGEEVVDEVFGDTGVAGVAGADHSVGDDLAVGVNRDVTTQVSAAPGSQT